MDKLHFTHTDWRCAAMPEWIAWLRENWLSILLGAGALVAVIFVYANRKLLFYKE